MREREFQRSRACDKLLLTQTKLISQYARLDRQHASRLSSRNSFRVGRLVLLQAAVVNGVASQQTRLFWELPSVQRLGESSSKIRQHLVIFDGKKQHQQNANNNNNKNNNKTNKHTTATLTQLIPVLQQRLHGISCNSSVKIRCHSAPHREYTRHQLTALMKLLHPVIHDSQKIYGPLACSATNTVNTLQEYICVCVCVCCTLYVPGFRFVNMGALPSSSCGMSKCLSNASTDTVDTACADIKPPRERTT